MAEKKYIELQKALNVCEMHYQHCLEMHNWSGDTTAYDIMRDIETIPTADVVEVVHGEWETTNVTQQGDEVELFHHHHKECKFGYGDHSLYGYDYCPNCGAKMDVTDTNVGGK